MKAELFELLFRVLHHNWRYFFKSSVLASVQRGIAEEQMENEAQFSAIMQVMQQLSQLENLGFPDGMLWCCDQTIRNTQG